MHFFISCFHWDGTFDRRKKPENHLIQYKSISCICTNGFSIFLLFALSFFFLISLLAFKMLEFSFILLGCPFILAVIVVILLYILFSILFMSNWCCCLLNAVNWWFHTAIQHFRCIQLYFRFAMKFAQQQQQQKNNNNNIYNNIFLFTSFEYDFSFSFIFLYANKISI